MTQTTVTQVTTDDPAQDAFDPKPQFQGARTYYGRIRAEAWYCVLEKGKGKVVYNPSVHGRDKRSTAIDLALDTLDEMKLQFAITRSMLSWEPEWNKFTLPSIKALGIPSLAALNGAWVAMQFTPTGRKYQSKNGEKEAQAMKFLSLYADETSCRAAYLQEKAARGGDEDDGNGNGHTPNPAPAAAQPQPQVDPNRVMAEGFLKALCAMHKNNSPALEAQINAMPQISKYFNINSPETQAFVRQAQGINDN